MHGRAVVRLSGVVSNVTILWIKLLVVALHTRTPVCCGGTRALTRWFLCAVCDKARSWRKCGSCKVEHHQGRKATTGDRDVVSELAL